MRLVMLMTSEGIEELCIDQCIPCGYKYTLVVISEIKRTLAEKIPAEFRLKFLEHLDKWAADDGRTWLTAEMIAAIEPMCDKGNEIAREAKKLPRGKFLDVYAETFSTFAVLNPSLIAALQMSPTFRARAEYEANRFTAEQHA
jgi:hypothetical protein